MRLTMLGKLMLPAQADLERAVRLQRQAYALLGWFRDHLERALFPAHEAHSAMDSRAVAQQWIEANFSHLPTEIAPAAADIPSLSALFSSYLTTSFEIVDHPSYRLQTTTSCWCDVCAYLARCAHLQPKRLSPGDKAHAERLELAALEEIAAELDISVQKTQLRNLLSDQTMREYVALVAYTKQLLQRLDGDPGDPAILVLWRKFAWTRNGAPKKGFSLTAQDIINAHEQIVKIVTKTFAIS